MGFFRQECWSGLPFPPPGDLPNSGVNPASTALQADSLLTELSAKTPRKVIILQKAETVMEKECTQAFALRKYSWGNFMHVTPSVVNSFL